MAGCAQVPDCLIFETEFKRLSLGQEIPVTVVRVTIETVSVAIAVERERDRRSWFEQRGMTPRAVLVGDEITHVVTVDIGNEGVAAGTGDIFVTRGKTFPSASPFEFEQYDGHGEISKANGGEFYGVSCRHTSSIGNFNSKLLRQRRIQTD